MGKRGKVRHIGVSNFNIAQVQELARATGVLPANNQLELNPFSTPAVKDTVAWMQNHSIVVTAYGSLGHAGSHLQDLDTRALQQKYHKPTAQLLLRWALDKGVAVLPGATTPKHIRDNLDVADFQLMSNETQSLEAN